MQMVTKLAIGVGIVVIGLGTYYVASNLGEDKSPTADLPKAPAPPGATAEKQKTPGAPVGRLANKTGSPLPSPRIPSGRSSDTTTPSVRTPGAATQPATPTPPRDLAATPPPAPPTTRPTVTTAPSLPGLQARSGTATSTPPFDSRIEASPTTLTPPSPQPTPKAATTAGATAPKTNKEHVIQAGDSFSRLAVKYFGHAKQPDPGRQS